MCLQLLTGIILLWGVTFPDQALNIIHQLKWQIRQHIVRQEGQREWLQFTKKFREKTTKAGYSTELVNEILEVYRKTITEELGNQRADKILGC